MSTLTISPENQNRLAIAVPIVAMLLSLFVVYPTWMRYNDLVAVVATQRKSLDDLRATPLPDVGAVPPADAGLPSEPPKFLGQLRVVAQMARCRVIGFDLGASGKQDSGPVRAVRARVDLEGRYTEIRDFLFRLAGAPRLYVVTDCAVSVPANAAQSAVSALLNRPPGTLHATIEIERYVTPPGT